MQEMAASLCFRGQRIFVQNASGWFGSAPLEASGDFGIHPEEGEFHLMCQVCSYLGETVNNYFALSFHQMYIPQLFRCILPCHLMNKAAFFEYKVLTFFHKKNIESTKSLKDI